MKIKIKWKIDAKKKKSTSKGLFTDNFRQA